jgi:predicted membrane-bound mannosyltransferase
MFKSVASAVALTGVLVVVIGVGAVALRLYSLGCRVRHVTEMREQR